MCSNEKYDVLLYAGPSMQKLRQTMIRIYQQYLRRILEMRNLETRFTGHVMHHQFNIQQLYVLPKLYLCVLYLSENKQRLVPLTA